MIRRDLTSPADPRPPTRQRLIPLLLLVVVSSGVGYGVSLLASGNPTRALTVTSIDVGAGFRQLVTTSSRVYVSDSGFPSSRYEPSCESLELDPATLRQDDASPCSNSGFGITGEQVDLATSPLGRYENCDPENSVARVVRVDAVGKVVTTGAIVMRFRGGCSWSSPDVVYTSTSLWAYDCTTGPSGDQGEIIRVSLATGAVEENLPMPSDCRVYVAADDDGFFIAPFGGEASDQSVYFLANDATRPVVVMQTRGSVAWMLASDDSVYLQETSIGSEACADNGCQIWRFDGQGASPTLVNSDLEVTEPSAVVGSNTVIALDVPAEPVDYEPPKGTIPRFGVVRTDLISGDETTIIRLPRYRPVGYPTWSPSYQESPSLSYEPGAVFILTVGRLYRLTGSALS